MPGPDAPVEDNAVPPPTDSGTPPEKDADAGVTPPTDAPVDAPPDALFEAGEVDAAALLAFPTQLAQAVCARFATCCSPAGDASAFDMSQCVTSYYNYGYQGSTTGADRLGSGNVLLDPAKAQSCLSQVAAVDCSANLRTSAQEKSILSACFGALTGTQQAGQGCASAIECAPGLFCTPAGASANDAGYTGICQALRGAGASCADFGVNNSNASETICSYRGSGNTGVVCHNEDLTTGVFFTDAAAWQCAPQQALEAGCNVNVDCTSALCDPGPDPFNNPLYVCTNAETFIYPFACQTFIKDGGP